MRHFRRFVALLLVPCLLADPATTDAVTGSSPQISTAFAIRSRLNVKLAEKTLFEQEALLLTERWFRFVISPTQAVFEKTRLVIGQNRASISDWWGIHISIPRWRH